MFKNKILSIKDLYKINSYTNENDWYTSLRKMCLAEIYIKEFPKLKNIDMSKWNLSVINKDNINFKKNNFTITYTKNNSSVIIEQNYGSVLIKIPENIKDFLIVKDIFSAMNSIDFFKIFSKITPCLTNKITLLHYLYLNSGLYIKTLKGLKETLNIEYYVFHQEEKYDLFNHLVLDIGESTSVNFTENYFSNNYDNIYNIISEIFVGENANCTLNSINEFNKNQKGTIIKNSIVDKNAVLNMQISAMNEGDTYFDNKSFLQGDGSESNLKIVTIGTDKQNSYFNSELINQGLNTRSDILEHGVLLDESNIMFNGVGTIIKGSSGSTAYQSSRLLTLSDNANAEANPLLLIDENDVAAGHGASLGKIDEEQLYYLQSRGLDLNSAYRLIILGFLSPVTEKISQEYLVNKIIKTVDYKITKVGE